MFVLDTTHITTTINHRAFATYSIEVVNGTPLIQVIEMILGIFDVLSLYIGVLICVAFYTLAERKFMGSVQRRLGPNVVGFFGLLQAFADALKLILKELVVPYRANQMLFIFAPFLFLTLALFGWTAIPLAADVVVADLLYGLLFIYLVSSLSVFGVIIAGWASNSKYPFLGALRSAAQMISYEVSMGFILIIVAFLAGTFNIVDIVLVQQSVWFGLLISPLFLMFLVSILAETNRAPFDLPEAEAELVAGYNLEYSGIMFAMFFLAEYSNMLLMSVLTIHLFLGGWFASFFSVELLWLVAEVLSWAVVDGILLVYRFFSGLLFLLFGNLSLLVDFYFVKGVSVAYTDALLIYSGPHRFHGSPAIMFFLFVARFGELLGAFWAQTPFDLVFSATPFLEAEGKSAHECWCLSYTLNGHGAFHNTLVVREYKYVGLKLVLLSVFFVLTRSALPRYRYDQLMYIGWKAFLPVTLGYLFFVAGVCYFFGILPENQLVPFFLYYQP